MASEPVVIVPYQDGPYLVRGPVILRDQAGRSIPVSRGTVALCRCGKSRMRPFCDGTHQVVRFRAASAAEGPPASRSNGAPLDGDGEAHPGGNGP
jgi:CDGSH-type Zn-finger protein